MLSHLRTHLAYHFRAANTSFNLLCHKPITTLMTILVIAIAIALPALFWVTIDNVKHLTTSWQHQGHISLYLKTPLSNANQTAFLERLRTTEGVGSATLKSAAEGLAELQQQEGMQDIMHYMSENPLPVVIDVVPAIVINTPEKLEQLFQQLKLAPEVEQAKLDLQWITRLQAILSFATKAAYSLMLLLALAVVLIIGNTLHLAINNRQEEIQILKLIGAADDFIVRPFLYSGIWYGLGGAMLAVFLVNIFMLSIALAVNQLAAAYQMHYLLLGLSIRQILLLLFSAIILGWIGAWLSVKRQLDFIEPYK